MNLSTLSTSVKTNSSRALQSHAQLAVVMKFPNRKRAIEELVHGRESAYKLQLSLRRSLTDPTSLSAYDDLIAKILGSFGETLSILDCPDPDEVSQLPASNSHSWGSSESCKPSATSKDRRGCYRRRKTSETWSKESSTWIDDGHAWRKYGQKVILHSEYPRNYFRCTHKFDQGCQATKQVQMIQDNPTLFRTTYHGRHTCKSILKAPQIIVDTTSRDSSLLLCFDQSTNPNNNENRHNDSLIAVFPFMKQETREVVQSLFQNQTSTSDYFLSPDLTGGPMNNALSPGSDHGDVISSGVYSCTASTHDSLGMDMVMGSVDDFDDVLQFEF